MANAFTFEKYNRNATVRITGTVPETLANGDMIYVDTSGAPQLMDDTASVLGLYIVAEEASASDKYVVAFPIKHDDRIRGRAISAIYTGLNILGEACGLYDEDNQYFDVDASNEYFVVLSQDTSENLKLNSGETGSLTVVTGGAALAAGDLFSLDGASKTTKTLGDVVYVAGATYESGTSVTVKLYTYPVVVGLKA